MDRSVTYQIKVQGTLDEGWSHWFGGMTVKSECASDGSAVSIITGDLVDQVALRGLLSKIWDLNLIVTSVARIGLDASKKGEKSDE